MTYKLLTEHHLEFVRLKEATQARLNLHLSKCRNVGNHMSRLNYLLLPPLSRVEGVVFDPLLCVVALGVLSSFAIEPRHVISNNVVF